MALKSTLRPTLSEAKDIRSRLVVRLWPVSLIFLGVYIPTCFMVLNDPISGWIQVGVLIVILFTIAFYYKTRNAALVSNVLAMLGIPVLLPWLFTGGVAGTGFWWSIVYVLWVFFVAGERWAVFWLSLTLAITAGIFAFAKAGYFDIAYTDAQLLHMFLAYGITFLLVFLFNRVLEYFMRLANEEIRERRKTEAQLLKTTRQLNDAQKIARIGSWEWDVPTNTVTWSDALYDIFGVTRAQFPGSYEGFLELVHPEDREYTNFIITQAFQTGVFPDYYHRIVRPDGKVIINHARGEVIKDANGQTILMVGTGQDVTEVEEAKRSLELMNTALASKNQEVEQFAYVASHDLKEPLRTITGYASFLKQEYGDQCGEQGLQYLDRIMHATVRMRTLIEDLLDYSRLGHGKDKTTVDFSKEMEAVLVDLDKQIKDSGARIEAGPLPALKAYQTEVRLLLQNLLSNALKFRKPEEPPVIRISAVKDHQQWTFSVSDNGIGIKAEFLDRIFVIFKRLHARDAYSGSGIGLAHCKKIVELHGGRIWAESEPGKGSTFYFTIPG